MPNGGGRTVRSAQAWFAEYAMQPGALLEVAEFCHVQPATALAWQQGTWPRGEQLYRLWAFLEFRGYQLSELEKLPKPSRELLLIIASGQLSFEDAQTELKYQNLQDVYRLLRHAGGLTKERAWKLEELVRQHLPALEEYRRRFTGELSDRSIEQKLETSAVRSVEAVSHPPTPTEQSSLARLLRLVVKRVGEVDAEELKQQLQDVPPDELEAFALLLLEIV